MIEPHSLRGLRVPDTTTRDLVAFSLLPSIWQNLEPQRVAESLLDVLLGTLRIELAYLRMPAASGAQPVSAELARLSGRSPSSADLAAIARCVEGAPGLLAGSIETLPSPVAGGAVRVACIPIAWRGGEWLLFVGSREAAFPTPSERLLLRTACNHAAVAIERCVTVRELRETRAAAESANRDKDEFLANVSHEIRTPMNAILGMTELALDSPLSQEQRGWLQAVKSAGEHLLTIVETLLDFSKAGAHRIELEQLEFSVRAELSGMLGALAIRAHKKGLELLLDVADSVPERIVGDAGRLRQVLINLVDNAIKFTSRGEVALTVTLGEPLGDARQVELCFAVRDTGIGVPHHLHRVIFEAFAQGDTSTTRRFGGTGLGLTIASQLALLMQGSISLESVSGVGSTFLLRARFAMRPRESAAAPIARPFSGSRALIVDGNAASSALFASWLGGWGFETKQVGDGLSALEAVLKGPASDAPYRLLLVDSDSPALPGGNLPRSSGGGRFLRLLRTNAPFGSSAVTASSELKLQKPILKEELLQALRDLLEPLGVEPRRGQRDAGTLAPAEREGGLRVLVAEDNEFNVTLVCELLRRRGHQVHVVVDGQDVEPALARSTYDLLLLDLHMPSKDGFAVIEQIRSRERLSGGHLPVVALTARSREQDRARCFSAGMDDFLTKPLSSAALWAAIERVGARKSG